MHQVLGEWIPCKGNMIPREPSVTCDVLNFFFMKTLSVSVCPVIYFSGCSSARTFRCN